MCVSESIQRTRIKLDRYTQNFKICTKKGRTVNEMNTARKGKVSKKRSGEGWKVRDQRSLR